MPFSVQLATREDAAVMQPMLRAYQQILAGYSASVDVDRELEEVWFEKPDQLYPYLVKSGERAVGLLLLCGRLYAEASGADVDYYINDLYVEPDLRGCGAAEFAVDEILGRYAGTWGLDVLVENGRAMGFWKRVLEPRGLEIEHADGASCKLRFTTG